MSEQSLAAPAASFRGVDITFTDLTFEVLDRATNAPKKILHGISGTCASGRLCALMGPSGAGKSTLLDVLALNSFGGTIGGQILVNGKPRRKSEFAALSCYVQQKDILPPSATVREAITTSALLKLPRTMSLAEKKQRVEDVLKELDLLGCADTLIGDETIGLKGISGGQKRRVSVGIELVKDPAVIFLDEPTSGLDSEMAMQVIDSLQALARKRRTVVCTIHQPNSDITDMFDDFLLLAKGQVMYSGPWAGAVPFFESQGHKCPLYKNPTDFFMSVISDPQVAVALANGFVKYSEAAANKLAPVPESVLLPAPAAAITDSVAVTMVVAQPSPFAGKDAVAITVGTHGEDTSLPRLAYSPSEVSDASTNVAESGLALNRKGPAFHLQVAVLVIRNFRNWIRNPMMLGSELVQYLFLALFIGAMYCKLPDDLDDGIFQRSACIWFALTVLSFTPSYTAVTSWDKDRHLLKRELKQGQYSVTAFYLSRSVVTVPFQLMQCALFVSIMYFFVGLQVDAGKFFLFLVVLWMFQMTSEGIGFLCAVATKQATYGIILLTFVLLLLLSFSGFLTVTIPVYFRWVHNLSYLTYAFSSLLYSELDGLTLWDNSVSPAVPVAGASQMPSSVDTGLSLGANVGIVAAQMVGMELLKLFGLHLAHWVKIV